MPRKTWTILDHDQNLNLNQISLGPEHLSGSATGYSVSKQTLRAGLSQGVDVIEVQSGDLRYVVVPTRGMNIWKASIGSLHLGWQSPVKGPVHPAFVHLSEPSGIGFLDGFDEWVCRCGLESNGAPEFNPNGTLRYGLHGKIANLPAHQVEVTIDSDKGEIIVTGTVEEARLFGAKLRLVSSITSRVGWPGLTITDTVTNMSAERCDMQLLYHINFGAPLAAPGSKIVLPIKKLAPNNAGPSASDLPTWHTHGPETPGAPEVVFFADLACDDRGRTRALLHNADGTQGASIKCNKHQLPYFIVWKNRHAACDGYVTGMEPATNFPNTKSFEKQMGRVVPLGPGESCTFEVEIEAHPDAAAVRDAQAAVKLLQEGVHPQILPHPDPDWSPR